MPSFDDETIEKWRHDRVTSTAIKKNKHPVQAGMAIRTVEEDIAEEQRRLGRAVQQVKDSTEILKNLARRRASILQDIADLNK
jgi:hypothetical protein